MIFVLYRLSALQLRVYIVLLVPGMVHSYLSFRPFFLLHVDLIY